MANSQGPRIRKTETSDSVKKTKKGKKSESKKVSLPLGKLKPKLFDSKFGKILAKVGRVIFPGFLRRAFEEIRLTTWPSRSETLRLTWAVFVFAVIFSIIVAALDFVLDKVFRSIILG